MTENYHIEVYDSQTEALKKMVGSYIQSPIGNFQRKFPLGRTLSWVKQHTWFFEKVMKSLLSG